MLPDWERLAPDQKLAVMEPERVKGASAQDLADLFSGATRNAVVGFMQRQKVPLLGKPFKAWPPAPDRERMMTERARQRTQIRVRRENEKRATTVTEKVPPTRVRTIVDDTPMAQRKTLMELSDHVCRWPVGDPVDPDFHFCGAPPTAGGPYCRMHERRAAYSPRDN